MENLVPSSQTRFMSVPVQQGINGIDRSRRQSFFQGEFDLFEQMNPSSNERAASKIETSPSTQSRKTLNSSKKP